MDIDRGLVAALLREGYEPFSRLGIADNMLEGEGKDALRFVETYWRGHKKLPTLEVVRDQTSVTFLGLPVEPLNFWATEIKKRHLYNAIQQQLGPVLDHMELGDSHAALDVYRRGFFALEGLFKDVVHSVEPVFSDLQEIFDDHDRARLGITGIPTPFPTLNEVTQGWQEEELIVIAGRPGLGKTTLMLLMALHAWQQGKKVLIVSTEMSRKAIRRRTASFACKVSYGRLRKGRLTETEFEKFKDDIAAYKDDPRLLMLGAGMCPTLEDVEAKCLLHKPDMVFIDGFYLMRSSLIKSRNKSERIADLLDLTKDMLKRLKIPGMITTQMNRPPQNQRSASAAKPDLDRLAFSDNMAMIADYVFFLERNEKLRSENLVKLMPVKTREADFVRDLYVNWDFEHQNFTESDRKPDEEEKAQSRRAAAFAMGVASKAFKDDDDNTPLDPISNVTVPW